MVRARARPTGYNRGRAIGLITFSWLVWRRKTVNARVAPASYFENKGTCHAPR